MEVGSRVRVGALDEGWSADAAASLVGHTGTVESLTPDRNARGEPIAPQICVRFDDPLPRKWWQNQGPVRAFHFDQHELEELGEDRR